MGTLKLVYFLCSIILTNLGFIGNNYSSYLVGNFAFHKFLPSFLKTTQIKEFKRFIIIPHSTIHASTSQGSTPSSQGRFNGGVAYFKSASYEGAGIREFCPHVNNRSYQRMEQDFDQMKEICLSTESLAEKQEKMITRLFSLWNASSDCFEELLNPDILFNVRSPDAVLETILLSEHREYSLGEFRFYVINGYNLSPFFTIKESFPASLRDIYYSLLCVFEKDYLHSIGSVDSLLAFIDQPPTQKINVDFSVVERESMMLAQKSVKIASSETALEKRQEALIQHLQNFRRYSSLCDQSNINCLSGGRTFLRVAYTALSPLVSTAFQNSRRNQAQTMPFQRFKEALKSL